MAQQKSSDFSAQRIATILLTWLEEDRMGSEVYYENEAFNTTHPDITGRHGGEFYWSFNVPSEEESLNSVATTIGNVWQKWIYRELHVERLKRPHGVVFHVSAYGGIPRDRRDRY